MHQDSAVISRKGRIPKANLPKENRKVQQLKNGMIAL